jgi:hypothetical protein
MFPLPESFRPGMWLNSVKAEWFATVSKIFNDITGVGITIKKPASGMDWVIVLNVDKTTIEVDSSTNKVRVKTGSITATHLAASVAGNGLAGGAGTALSVNVDGSTLEISSDSLRVKDGGITEAKLASNSVTSAKIAANTITTADVNASYANVTGLFPTSLTFVNGICTSAS